MKKCKKVNTRDKAWLGAVIGGVANIATSLINSYQQEQAQKKQLAAEQRMQQQQNIANANIAAQQQAGAMTNALANQNYVDEYKNKMIMKNGGYYDRLSKEKAIFKCGGKKKKKAAGGYEEYQDKKKKKKTNNDSLREGLREREMNRSKGTAFRNGYMIETGKSKPLTDAEKKKWIKDSTKKVEKHAQETWNEMLKIADENEKKRASKDSWFPEFKCGGKKKRKC